MSCPQCLARHLKPVTVVCGHYGSGKTNFCVNLAVDLAKCGKRVTLADLDVVNPYFRASEQRAVLESCGVTLIAPVFSEAGTSLDVPSLTGKIAPAIQAVHNDAQSQGAAASMVIIDAGGDDVGATALGRFAREIAQGDYAMLYIDNAYRNLVMDPQDAFLNAREIEAACHLRVTAIVSNAHLKSETNERVVKEGVQHARRVAELLQVPYAAACAQRDLANLSFDDTMYGINIYVRSPWE